MERRKTEELLGLFYCCCYCLKFVVYPREEFCHHDTIIIPELNGTCSPQNIANVWAAA